MEFLFKIKWLNGPLAGRELNLPAGETRLGGSDADIALSLEQDVSAILTVTSEGITLTPAVPVWVDGQRWDCTQPLPGGKVIDIAGQGLILGAPDSTLPSMPVPQRLTAKPASSKARFSPWWLALLVIPLVTAFGILAFSHHQTEPVAPFNPQHWLTQAMKNPELKGVEVQIDERGIVHLSGLSASSKSVAELREQLRQHGMNFYDQSIGVDTLLQQVRQVLALKGYYNVEVNSGATPDSVEIHGAINSDTAWLRASNRLQQIKGLKHWKVINDQAELFQRLLEKLEQQALLEGVSIRVVGRELLINGQLDKSRAVKMKQLTDEFNRDGEPRLTARFESIPAGIAGNILPAPVVSVGGNKNSVYLQLANNMRLQQGAVLPNGFKIYALSPTSVSLIQGERLISLPLNH